MTWNGARLVRAAKLVLVNSVGMAYAVPHSVRLASLRAAGYRVGRVAFLSGTVVRCTSLEVGDGSYVNHGCLFDRGDITLGRNVYVSTGVTFATGGHDLGPPDKRAGQDYSRPIVVEDGCWLGANVVVLSGVRIASGCVIGAGAIVTKDTEPDGVYVGVPARRVRTLD
ncbi:acyltransferase [uncultured Friedmanniella sp.]|uniref:acyltransferase n=1 Tax=uncultured Friedmanniella sp. TaxID=335381 RepID=UPI0035CC69D9